jgi:hypothetical protein
LAKRSTWIAGSQNGSRVIGFTYLRRNHHDDELEETQKLSSLNPLGASGGSGFGCLQG